MGEVGEVDLIGGGGGEVLVPTVERRCDNKNGGNGPNAASPLPVGQGGEGSPEGGVVAAACPGGKSRVSNHGSPESFQLQMRISFPFLHAKDLRTSLLIMRNRSFFTLLYVGGTYARGRGGGQRPPPYVGGTYVQGRVGSQRPPPVLPPLRVTGTVVLT